MARLIRPVRQWPLFRNHSCFSLTFNHFTSSPLPFSISTEALLQGLSLATLPSSYRTVHHRPRRRKSPNALRASNIQEVDADDSDSDTKKSRNQKKREARQAVRWGMELVSFPTSHIKRILRAAKVDEDVYEALMTAKKLGPDVREGKRRQFNYVGKLLRDVEPELMNALIRATREGDQKMLQALAGSHAQNNAEDEDDDEESQEEQDENIISIASRWFDGLLSKDLNVTNEIYSLDSIDFDRQELRKLVRKVHSLRERHKDITDERNKEKANQAEVVEEDVKSLEVVEEDVKSLEVVEEDVKSVEVVEEDVKAVEVVEEDVKAVEVVEEDVKAVEVVGEDVKAAVVVEEDVKAAVTLEEKVKAAVVVKEDTKAAVEAAEVSLTNFLRSLAKQIPSE